MRQKVLSFAVIGGGVGLFGLGLLAFLVQGLHLEQNFGFLLQMIAAVQLNFMLCERFTWKGTEGTYLAKMGKFYASRAGTLVLNQILFGIAGSFFPFAVSYGVSLLITSVLNFLLSEKFVFTRQQWPTWKRQPVPVTSWVGAWEHIPARELLLFTTIMLF